MSKEEAIQKITRVYEALSMAKEQLNGEYVLAHIGFTDTEVSIELNDDALRFCWINESGAVAHSFCLWDTDNSINKGKLIEFMKDLEDNDEIK